MATDSGTYTPEIIARRLEMARELLKPRKVPIQHWAQGLDELAQGALGGYMYGKAERDELLGAKAQDAAWAKLIKEGGGEPTAPAAAPPVVRSDVPTTPAPIAGPAPTQQPIRMASLPPELMPDAPKPSIDSSKLPIMNLTDPRQTIIGETIENLPPAPRPGPALPGAPVPQPPPSPVATALNAPAATPPTAAPSPVAAALNTPAGGAMPTTGGGGMNDRIAAMLESKDPYERRMARGVAQSIFAKRLEGEKPTDEMREYQLYRAQGGTKPFFDYKTDLAKAKAQNISVETKVETEQQKLAAKRFDALNSEITSSASSARTKIATLDRLGQLIDDPNIKTGKGAELILEAKKLAKTAGFDVGDLSGPEAMRAIGNQFVLELRNPSGGAGMPGAMSDSDRVFLQGMGPGLLNTPEGNRLIVDYMKRMAQRSLDVERLRRDYIKKNKHLDEGFYDALSEFSDKNPIFPEANKKQSAPAATAAPPPAQNDPLGIR